MEIICNSIRVINKPSNDEGIGDTGTTDHFLKEGAPVDVTEVETNPMEIGMPNGTIEKSTYTCYLRIPSLPKEFQKGQIAPGLSHSSLVSIKKLCQGGCEVIFKEKECEVWYKKRKVLTGRAIGPGGLWILPINEREPLEAASKAAPQNPPSLANATVYTLPYK